MEECVIEVGAVINEWTVLRKAEHVASTASYWICRCSCGQEACLRESGLKRGKPKSCGHLLRKRLTAIEQIESMPPRRYPIKVDPSKVRPYKPKNIEQFGMDEWMFKG